MESLLLLSDQQRFLVHHSLDICRIEDQASDQAGCVPTLWSTGNRRAQSAASLTSMRAHLYDIRYFLIYILHDKVAGE